MTVSPIGDRLNNVHATRPPRTASSRCYALVKRDGRADPCGADAVAEQQIPGTKWTRPLCRDHAALLL